MEDNDNNEYVEELVYVILELGTDLTVDTLEKLPQGEGIFLSDLNESPIFTQLGGQVLSGDIDDPVGTNLLFEIDEKQYERTGNEIIIMINIASHMDYFIKKRINVIGLLSMLSTMRNSTEQDSHNKPRWTAQYRYNADKIIKTTGVDLVPKEVETETEGNDQNEISNLDVDII
ncbi:unnamed protein product [Cunninghamella blakesleeana]